MRDFLFWLSGALSLGIPFAIFAYEMRKQRNTFFDLHTRQIHNVADKLLADSTSKKVHSCSPRAPRT